MARLSMLRSPEVFIPVSALSAAPGTIFTPGSGGYADGKFRLLGFDLYASVAGLYNFIDGNTGATIYSTYLDGSTGKGISLGMIGVLSTQKNSALKISGAGSVSGTVFCEIAAENETL